MHKSFYYLHTTCFVLIFLFAFERHKICNANFEVIILSLAVYSVRWGIIYNCTCLTAERKILLFIENSTSCRIFDFTRFVFLFLFSYFSFSFRLYDLCREAKASQLRFLIHPILFETGHGEYSLKICSKFIYLHIHEI